MRSFFKQTSTRYSLILLALLSTLLPLHAAAQIDCQNLPHWAKLENGLQINQKHVFCGEWRKGRPKGFHARPNGTNPATVGQFEIQDTANSAGIYTGRWSYRHHPEKNKFSSMFPDQCSPQQILNSINYATNDGKTSCPRGAPNWTQCGKNKPLERETVSTQYCHVNNQNFSIGYAPPNKGKINTAFPLFE